MMAASKHINEKLSGRKKSTSKTSLQCYWQVTLIPRRNDEANHTKAMIKY